jgi:hypothetical protein
MIAQCTGMAGERVNAGVPIARARKTARSSRVGTFTCVHLRDYIAGRSAAMTLKRAKRRPADHTDRNEGFA